MVLDGWKAIAAWFASHGIVKSIRTLQRWARLAVDPLPVRHGRAVEERVAAWLARRVDSR